MEPRRAGSAPERAPVRASPRDVAGDEAALIARLKVREEAAFEELVRLHGHRMLSVARRFFSDDGDAQDALQDAFLNVHRSISGFSGASRLGTWLHRVVVNASLMKIRARRRRPEVTLGDTEADAWAASAVGPRREEAASSALSMARAEARARVRECIAGIPETYRTALLLCDIEGMQILEASRLLDVSPSTLKMRLHRARHLLRKTLDPFMKEDAP